MIDDLILKKFAEDCKILRDNITVRSFKGTPFVIIIDNYKEPLKSHLLIFVNKSQENLTIEEIINGLPPRTLLELNEFLNNHPTFNNIHKIIKPESISINITRTGTFFQSSLILDKFCINIYKKVRHNTINDEKRVQSMINNNTRYFNKAKDEICKMSEFIYENKEFIKSLIILKLKYCNCRIPNNYNFIKKFKLKINTNELDTLKQFITLSKIVINESNVVNPFDDALHLDQPESVKNLLDSYNITNIKSQFRFDVVEHSFLKAKLSNFFQIKRYNNYIINKNNFDSIKNNNYDNIQSYSFKERQIINIPINEVSSINPKIGLIVNNHLFINKKSNIINFNSSLNYYKDIRLDGFFKVTKFNNFQNDSVYHYTRLFKLQPHFYTIYKENNINFYTSSKIITTTDLNLENLIEKHLEYVKTVSTEYFDFIKNINITELFSQYQHLHKNGILDYTEFYNYLFYGTTTKYKRNVFINERKLKIIKNALENLNYNKSLQDEILEIYKSAENQYINFAKNITSPKLKNLIHNDETLLGNIFPLLKNYSKSIPKDLEFVSNNKWVVHMINISQLFKFVVFKYEPKFIEELKEYIKLKSLELM